MGFFLPNFLTFIIIFTIFVAKNRNINSVIYEQETEIIRDGAICSPHFAGSGGRLFGP